MKHYFSSLMFILLLTGFSYTGYAQTYNYGLTPVRDFYSDQPLGAGSTPDFYAYSNNNVVTIKWRSENEYGIDRFVVEKSTDGVHYAPLHTIVAMGGVDLGRIYEDGDSYPAAQPNNYRVKTIGKDGQAWYSQVVTVDMTGKVMPSIKPSVIYINSTIRFTTTYDQPVTVVFYNTSGVRTGAFLVNGSSFDVATSGWSKGLYFYRVSDATHPLIDAGKLLIF